MIRKLWLCGVFALAALAQQALTNEAVIRMSKAGLSEDTILAAISSQPCAFAVGADDLIALKSAGVGNKIITAVVSKTCTGTAPAGGGVPAPAGALDAGAPAPAGALASAAVGTAAPLPPPAVIEIGVYVRKGDQWADLPPEVANFRTGGVLKTIGTVGIVKGDINGRLSGLHSPNQMRTPAELLVYTPDGVAITEYQLIRLREQKESREFRTVTGGVLHTAGGQNRDLLPFESQKIAPRTYRIALPKLTGGEYGLLPPASAENAGGGGRVGKLYSFRVVE